VAAGGVALFLAVGGDGPSEPARSGARAPLAGYTITYRVEVTIDAPERSRRVLTVRRPFAGSDRTTPEGPPGPVSGLVATGGHLYRLDPDRAVDLGDQGPAVAPGDLRLAAQLPALERLGLAEARGTAAFAGRACRRFRFGGPVTDPFKQPSDAEYADVCIDADGLVLAEEWYLDGKILRRTEAETVNVTPPGDEAFDLGGRPVVPAPAVTLTTLPADRLPDTGQPYWTADPPPAGFALHGRYRTAPADPASGLPLSGATVTADAYRSGVDVVWVEHRTGTDLPVEPPTGTGERVEAGTLGGGWLWLTPQGPQVRVAQERQVVVVRGTVGPDDLLAFARSIRPLQGGQ
jgi:hypothetical protein